MLKVISLRDRVRITRRWGFLSRNARRSPFNSHEYTFALGCYCSWELTLVNRGGSELTGSVRTPGSSRERHRDKNDSAGLSPDCQFTQSVPIHFELLSLYSPGVSRGTKNIIPPATTIKYPITQTIFVRNYNSSS